MQKNVLTYIKRNIKVEFLGYWFEALKIVLLRKACDTTCFTMTYERYNTKSFENFSKVQIVSQTL